MNPPLEIKQKRNFYPDEVWEQYRPLAEALYPKHTLKEIRERFAREDGFEPCMRKWREKFNTWGLTHKDWRADRKRLRTQANASESPSEADSVIDQETAANTLEVEGNTSRRPLVILTEQPSFRESASSCLGRLPLMNDTRRSILLTSFFHVIAQRERTKGREASVKELWEQFSGMRYDSRWEDTIKPCIDYGITDARIELDSAEVEEFVGNQKELSEIVLQELDLNENRL